MVVRSTCAILRNSNPQTGLKRATCGSTRKIFFTAAKSKTLYSRMLMTDIGEACKNDNIEFLKQFDFVVLDDPYVMKGEQ
jgi:hypothetical protein